MIKSRLAYSQLLLSGLVGFTMAIATSCRSCSTIKSVGGQVHGFVYTDIPDSLSPQGKRRGYVSAVTVFLKNTSSSEIGPKIVTDSRGWYAIPHVPAGDCLLGGQSRTEPSPVQKDPSESNLRRLEQNSCSLFHSWYGLNHFNRDFSTIVRSPTGLMCQRAFPVMVCVPF